MTDSANELEEQLLVFGMKNIFVENALDALEAEGIEIGHSSSRPNNNMVDTEMFEKDILSQAKRMANFYVLYYALENSARRLITEVLSEKFGTDWWQKSIPQKIKDSVKNKKKEESDTSMSIRSEDPLAYTNFGELIDIFNSQWTEFSQFFRSQRSLQDTLSQFNKIRNVVAHSCPLNEDEILRFKLLINDWLRIQT